MLNLDILLLILAILFLATFIKSVLGFGESLLAIPLLTMVVGIQLAATLVSLIVAGVTVLMILRNWRTIDIRATWQLTLSAIIGVPIGVWILKVIPERPITLVLGIILMLVGLYYLFRPQFQAIQGTPITIIFGLMSGILGGAYNMAGAPIIVYGAMQRWQSEDFRGTLQSYFIVVSLVILLNYAISGLLTSQVIQIAIISLPIMLLSFALGTYLAEHLPRQVFEKMLYVMLILLGLNLIIQNL